MKQTKPEHPEHQFTQPKNTPAIKEWAEKDRPREKLEMLGAQALSDAELFAILIGSGTKNQSAVELMKAVLAHCNNKLSNLGKMTVEQLKQFKGLGPAKAITIMAACELGRRKWDSNIEKQATMCSSHAIYQRLREDMAYLTVEEFWVMMLSKSLKVIKVVPISKGGIDFTTVDIRLILREALLCRATAVVVAHNHPSNTPKPSIIDDQLTMRIKQACEIMNIQLLDHVIVCENEYYSYNDEGKI